VEAIRSSHKTKPKKQLATTTTKQHQHTLKMGQKISTANKAAQDNADQEKGNIATLMTVLEHKRREFLAEVSLARGDGVGDKTEVQGGRTVNRISEIRISSNSGADPRLQDAIADFFTAAQGGDTPKAAAVEGAKALLETGLDSLFGATAGQGMEKRALWSSL